MNKLFTISLLLLTIVLYAEENKGIKVHVELISGTTQKAQFLGIENDSVSLGGYIKNQFTIIRIHKNQFKSIIDSSGTNLLETKEPSPITITKTKIDSIEITKQPNPIQQDSSSNEVIDLTNQSTDATKQVTKDSSTQINQAIIPTKIFVGYESTETQKTLTSIFTLITAKALKESDSSYHYESSERFNGCDNNTCIQNEWFKLGVKEILFGKISPSKSPDSLKVTLTRSLLKDSLPIINSFETSISAKTSISDAITADKLHSLIQESLGISNNKKKKNKSYIHVETDPEGATLSLSEKDALCKTPCTIVTLDTGKIVLNAYWKVEHLWGAQTTVRPIPGDTVRVSLKLKRITPEISIMSKPSGAEIFAGSSEIPKNASPLAYTPDKFTMTDPGFINIRLLKEGYRDTLISFYLAPIPETTINVSLEEIKDYKELEKQKEWFKNRQIYQWGKTMMGSSIAPILVGSIFLYLAQQNYNDADKIKDELKMPSIQNGKNYQKRMDENHDLAKKGDRDVIIGSSLIGTGIILFGIGLYLAF